MRTTFIKIEQYLIVQKIHRIKIHAKFIDNNLAQLTIKRKNIQENGDTLLIHIILNKYLQL